MCILVAKAEYEYRNSANDQAIHKAALYSHPDVLRVLIEEGASVNSKGQDTSSPLIMAAQMGHLGTVKLLIELGADINARNRHDITALLRATVTNHLDVVCELLDRKAVDGDALQLARELNYNDIALVLDTSPITTNDANVENVLMTATKNGNVNLISDLIRRGATIDIKGPVGETLFQIATRFPQIKKQEYDQEVSAYMKTGHKPHESLDEILQKAAVKSNAMAKLFLSQKLSDHDQESITQRVADISDHCKSPHFDADILGDKQKFYLNSSKNENKEILLDSCVNQGLIPEREEILEIMKRTEQREHGDHDE